MQLPKRKLYFNTFLALRTFICNSFITGDDVAYLPVCLENLHLLASSAQNAATRRYSKLPLTHPLIKIDIMPPFIKKLTYCPRIYDIKDIPESVAEVCIFGGVPLIKFEEFLPATTRVLNMAIDYNIHYYDIATLPPEIWLVRGFIGFPEHLLEAIKKKYPTVIMQVSEDKVMKMQSKFIWN